MSSSHYVQYYSNQAGGGISGFEGARFQNGHGIFASLLRFGLPVLKYLGTKAYNAGQQIFSDIFGGENVLQSLKTRGKDLGQDILRDAEAGVQRIFSPKTNSSTQTGS